MPRNTVFYHLGALGDFITALPAAAAWRARFPSVKLTLLGRPAFGALGMAAGIFDACVDATGARLAALFAERPDADISALLSVFDSAIAFCADDSPVLDHLSAAGVPGILHQPPFPSAQQPIVAYHLSLIGEPADKPSVPWIRVPQSDVARRIPGSHPMAAIHPGSGSPRKKWPFPRFRELAAHLGRRGLRVLWIGGEAEDRLDFPYDADVLRSPDLTDLAAILAGCAIYVGNDSGVSHLAAAVGCPGVALFGPSDPRVWGLVGKTVRNIAALPGCGPCHPGKTGDVPCTAGCMDRIATGQVVEAVDDLLDGGAR